MADQHRHATAPRCLDQRADFIQLHPDRLFHQHRHTGLDAVQRRGHMQIVRIGDDYRLGPNLRQHLPVVGVIRHAAFTGKGFGLRARVGNCAQLRFRDQAEVLIMLAAHDAGANQGDTKGCVQRAVLLSLLFLAIPELCSTLSHRQFRTAVRFVLGH